MGSGPWALAALRAWRRALGPGRLAQFGEAPVFRDKRIVRALDASVWHAPAAGHWVGASGRSASTQRRAAASPFLPPTRLPAPRPLSQLPRLQLPCLRIPPLGPGTHRY